MLAFALLCTYTVLTLIRPQEWAFDAGSISLTQICIVGSLLLVPFSRRNSISPPHVVCAALVLGTIMLSSVYNGWTGGALVRGQEFFATAFAPFLLFSLLVTSVERHKVIVWTLIISAMFMISNGVSQLASEDGIGWAGSELIEGGRIRYLGFLHDPNDLGLFFVVSLACALGLREVETNRLWRILATLTLPVLVYGIFLTQSRGALLALIMVFGVIGYYRFGIGRLFTIGVLVSPLLLWVLLGYREISSEEQSAYGRVEAWYAGIQMFLESPLVGVGMHGFVDHHQLTAHNSFVLVLAELGLLGYVAWFTLLTTTMLATRLASRSDSRLLAALAKDVHLRNSQETDQRKMLAAAYFLALIGFVATAFFLSRSYNTILYLVLGLSLANYRCAEEGRLPIYWYGIAVCGALLSIVFLFVVQRTLL